MKTNTCLSIAAALLLVSCSGNNKSSNTEVENDSIESVASVDMSGQWYLENIVVSDSLSVRPSDIAGDARQYISFEDSTYFIQTNCNTFSGSYAISGDSITLGDGIMTEMACDNMAAEDAIRQILPNIVTVSVENDSTARLNCNNPAQYILLRKAAEKK